MPTSAGEAVAYASLSVTAAGCPQRASQQAPPDRFPSDPTDLCFSLLVFRKSSVPASTLRSASQPSRGLISMLVEGLSGCGRGGRVLVGGQGVGIAVLASTGPLGSCCPMAADARDART